MNVGQPNGPLPLNHTERMQRALLSLDGLSVGDAFGQCFFCDASLVEGRLAGRHEPPVPWFYTDDTVMALSIVRCLQRFGSIECDALAEMFADEYAKEPHRGYGGTAHSILRQIGNGVMWESAAGQAFDGMGSMGNGGAMRSAPIGAYFAEDIPSVIEHARRSAIVTHAHPDGQAGAIAIAVAAAWAYNHRQRPEDIDCRELIAFAIDHTPDGDTLRGMKKALTVSLDLSPRTAAAALGNGSGVISSDTVPFTLWCVARHVRNYADALWTTVSAYGDCDTTCAIVGGIVVLSAGRDSIPQEWLAARESLKL